jgi:hypothetical protein
MVAAAIDHAGSTEAVAGFVLSRDTTADLEAEVEALLTLLRASPPGGSGTRITLRSAGHWALDHRVFESVQDTEVELNLAAARDVPSVRDAVVAVFLEKPPGELTYPRRAYGDSSSSMLLKFAAVKRVQQRLDKSGKVMLDASGKPLDTGDKKRWRLMVIGAVASAANYRDPGRPTAALVDDLSNTTTLTVAGDKVGDECDVAIIRTRRAIRVPTGGTPSVALDYVPISASLAVGLDARPVPRSRVRGFDYRAASNTLVFSNVDHHQGSEVLVSYKRWQRQSCCP